MTELVYYIRRGEHIKIGRTAQFYVRMKALRPDKVLAVEPGGRDVETVRHGQFLACHVADHPAGVEWFDPTPELLTHIDQLAAVHGVPEFPALPARKPRPPRPAKRADRPFAAPEAREQMARGLRGLRKLAGLTQAELAERMGVDQGTVSGMETCRRRVFTWDIRRICEAIDTPEARALLATLDALTAVMAAAFPPAPCPT